MGDLFSSCVTFKVVRHFFQILQLGLDVVHYGLIIIVSGHASTSGSIYKTDSIFSA